jgi:hypothetical protein
MILEPRIMVSSNKSFKSATIQVIWCALWSLKYFVTVAFFPFFYSNFISHSCISLSKSGCLPLSDSHLKLVVSEGFPVTWWFLLPFWWPCWTVSRSFHFLSISLLHWKKSSFLVSQYPLTWPYFCQISLMYLSIAFIHTKVQIIVHRCISINSVSSIAFIHTKVQIVVHRCISINSVSSCVAVYRMNTGYDHNAILYWFHQPILFSWIM